METEFLTASSCVSSTTNATADGQASHKPNPYEETDLHDRRKSLGALDWFRLAAAVLVIAIHTSPLAEINENADLFLTGVAARTAVPFFFAVSGYFADLSSTSGLKKLILKTAAVYCFATVIYLPFGTYHADLKKILFDGTFYHLWYLPACATGAAVVYALKRLPAPAAFSIAAALYVIGLFGDSYYNLISGIEPLHMLYNGFSGVFSYTRNGIFTAPVFMLYGNTLANRPPIRRRVFSILGLTASIALLTAERFSLRGITLAPHDNMFIFLIPTTFFLIRLLTSFKVKPRPFLRSMSTWIYIIHPIIIYNVHNSEIENPLQTAVIVTVISFPISAAISALMRKSKAAHAKTKQG